MPASPISTFGVFQSLLTNAVNSDATLTSATKASMLTRIAELAREVGFDLDFLTVESTGGSAAAAPLTRSIEIAVGVSGNNRVEWKLQNFSVPLTISGARTARGFLAGNVGASIHAAVDSADVSMQYRLSSSDTWKAFDRNTVLCGVTSIQFAVAIADQVAAVALPNLRVVAYQE